MDGWRDGWMDGRMNEWMDGWINGWMGGWRDGYSYRLVKQATKTNAVCSDVNHWVK